MTALSVWWRRNFGHRNDPPAMLPDPVRWTHTVCGPDAAALDAIDRERALGWELASWIVDGEHPTLTHSLVFRREDGAYRWRDDGFRGF